MLKAKEVDKTCFQLDMAYGNFKDLSRRTAFDKLLHDKAFNIAVNPKYDGSQCGLMGHKLFYKNFAATSPTFAGNSTLTVTGTILATKLYKSIGRKCLKI